MRNWYKVPMTNVIVILIFGGCAAAGRSMGLLVSGYGVTPQIATSFCGSQEAFAMELEKAKAHVRAGGSQRVAAGMTACRVLALIGMPNKQETVEVMGSPPVAHWTYREATPGGQDRLHLVIVGPGPDQRGIVQAVVW